MSSSPKCVIEVERRKDDDYNDNEDEEPVRIFAWKAKPCTQAADIPEKARSRENEKSRCEKTGARNREIVASGDDDKERGEAPGKLALRTALAIISRESPRRADEWVCFAEEEARFRFFRLMRLSRRISYGKTAREDVCIWKR